MTTTVHVTKVTFPPSDIWDDPCLWVPPTMWQELNSPLHLSLGTFQPVAIIQKELIKIDALMLISM